MSLLDLSLPHVDATLFDIPISARLYVFTGYGNAAAARNIKPAVMDGLCAQARTSISR